MNPGFSTQKLRDGDLGDVELIRQVNLSNLPRNVQRPDLLHGFIGELCQSASNSSGKLVLQIRIPNIVSDRAKPKVVWINAKRVVFNWAIVKHPQSFWNRSSQKLPGNPVGPLILASKPKLTVTISETASIPNPTRFSFDDLRPKIATWLIEAFQRATACFAGLGRKPLEFFPANRTVVGVHLKAFFLGVQRLALRLASLISFTPNAAWGQG